MSFKRQNMLSASSVKRSKKECRIQCEEAALVLEERQQIHPLKSDARGHKKASKETRNTAAKEKVQRLKEENFKRNLNR